jgi:arylsulfatase A-like enzyme
MIDMQALIDSGWHLIRRPRKDDLLYDLRADPEERTNRASDPAAAERLDRMRRALDELLGRKAATARAP